MKPLTLIFLALAGLLLLAIGGTILLVPHAFYASDGIVLGQVLACCQKFAPQGACSPRAA